MYINYRVLFYTFTTLCMMHSISQGFAQNALPPSPSPMAQQVQPPAPPIDSALSPIQPSLPQEQPPQIQPSQAQPLQNPQPVSNAFQKLPDELYIQAVRDIFQTFLHMNPEDFKQRVCGTNCQNILLQPFSTTLNHLRYMQPNGQFTQPVIQNTIQQLTQLQNRLVSYMRDRKLPFRAYALTEISDTTKEERLKKGDRIHFPSREQLQNIDPSLLTKTDAELLFFQKAIEFERTQNASSYSSITQFIQQQKQWIQNIPQNSHRHIRAHMDTLLNRVSDRLQNDDNYTDILKFVHNALPEKERTYIPLPPDQRDQDLVAAQQFLNDIKDIKDVYTDKPFDDDSKNNAQSKDIQNFFDTLSKTPQYDTRKKTFESFQRNIDQFLLRLPDTSQLKKDRQIITRTITDAVNQEFLDIGSTLLDKSPKDIQSSFASKTYPSLDGINDQDLQDALLKKRLSKTHIRLLLLQVIADIQRTTTFKNAIYDQKITMIFSALEKHLTKLLNAARQVDAKQKGARLNEAMIQEEKNFIANVRQMLEQKSPKSVIIEALKNLLQSQKSPDNRETPPASPPITSTTSWMGSDTKPMETSLFPNIVNPSKNQQPPQNAKKKPEEKKENFEKKILDGVKSFTEKVKNETTGGRGLFGSFFSKLFG